MADEILQAQIVPIDIEAEMKRSYLDYAMSVIVARAIPDVRDGLKPVQRRILVAMNDLGLASNRGFRKCAKICGDTSGNYHPHGEAVIYPTMVRLAQKCISLPARWRLDHGAYRFPVELWLNKKLKERTAALKPAVDAKRLEPNTVEVTC